MFSKIYLMSIVDGLKNTVIQHLSNDYGKAERMTNLLWHNYYGIRKPFLRSSVIEIENGRISLRVKEDDEIKPGIEVNDGKIAIGDRGSGEETYILQVFNKGRGREMYYDIFGTREEADEFISKFTPKMRRQYSLILNKASYKGVHQIDIKTGKETQITFNAYEENKDAGECWFPDGFDIIKL